jgi:hypothetical protein
MPFPQAGPHASSPSTSRIVLQLLSQLTLLISMLQGRSWKQKKLKREASGIYTSCQTCRGTASLPEGRCAQRQFRTALVCRSLT